MILMALLLTLGAPFWFNMLKSLSALRSLVARDISKEEEAAEAKSAKTGIDKVPAPPPV
jgi:hypothetical protein